MCHFAQKDIKKKKSTQTITELFPLSISTITPPVTAYRARMKSIRKPGITNERANHACSSLRHKNIWRGKRSGRDIAAHHLSSLLFHSSVTFNHLQVLVPVKSECGSSIWSRRNVADRVGQFTSLRLGLWCGSEEAGGAGKSEGGGNIRLYFFIILRIKKNTEANYRLNVWMGALLLNIFGLGACVTRTDVY